MKWKSKIAIAINATAVVGNQAVDVQSHTHQNPEHKAQREYAAFSHIATFQNHRFSPRPSGWLRLKIVVFAG